MRRPGQWFGGIVSSAALLTVAACDGTPGTAETAGSPQEATSLVAGIAGQNQEADRSLNLIVRLELSPEELFEVYEPAPGRIVISGAGAPSRPVLLPEEAGSLSIEQIWSRVAGAEPMPANLTAAVARMAEGSAQPGALVPAAITPPSLGGGNLNGRPGPRPPPKLDLLLPGPKGPLPPPALNLGGPKGTTPPPKLTLVGPPGPRPPPKLNLGGPKGITPPPKLNAVVPKGPLPPPPDPAAALDAGWCDIGYYALGYGACSQDWHDCVDNWENGRWAHHPDVEALSSNVCAAEGNAALKVTSAQWGGGTWNVPENTVRWYRNVQQHCDQSNCPDARGEVLNAAGGRFHFRFLVARPASAQ